MHDWLVLGAAGAGTYAVRVSLIVLFGRVEIPFVLQRSFRYVAPAVMAAILAPAVFAPDGAVELTNLRVPAALVAGAVAWRFSNIPATLVAGLAVFVGLDWVL